MLIVVFKMKLLNSHCLFRARIRHELVLFFFQLMSIEAIFLTRNVTRIPVKLKPYLDYITYILYRYKLS